MVVAVAHLQWIAVVVDAEQLHQVGLDFRRRQACSQEAACRGVVVEVIQRQLAIYPKSVIRISLCRTAKRNPNDRFGIKVSLLHCSLRDYQRTFPPEQLCSL